MKTYSIMSEKDIQHYLSTDPNAEIKLKEILCTDQNINIKREETFINGITVDLMIYSDQKDICSLVECKGSNINITDYVRGIGQVMQYEYFSEKNIPPKNEHSYSYNENYRTMMIVTSDFMKETRINISYFKYPKTLKLVEFNTKNYELREISHDELLNISKKTDSNTIALNFYYFRDNRIFELYILLKELAIKSLIVRGSINRNEMEDFLKSEHKVINNGNWRNAFITLSSMGFINSKNRTTSLGNKLAHYSYEVFAYYIYENYLCDYINLILEVMDCEQLYASSNQEIAESIKKHYNGKDVLYLTQSQGRYVSSFLNIMRDDYGILNFKPRSRKRRLIYDIREKNKESILKNIKQNTIAYEYLGEGL